MIDCRNLDVTRLAARLYQGSYPRTPIRPCGFQVLVLCAKELQQRAPEAGLRVLHCPLDDRADVSFSRSEWLRANRVAEEVVDLLGRGARILTTCAEGRNRSGLVNGLVLYRISALNGAECVEHIRQRRAGALTNEQFVEALCRLPYKLAHQAPHRERRALHRVRSIAQYLD